MKISDSGFQTAPGLRFTMGEILSDGSVIEPVLAASGDELALMRFYGNTSTIASQFACDDTTYHAPYVRPSLLRAVTFPPGIAKYGTRPELFQRITNSFERYACVPRQEASGLAYVLERAWVPECDPGPMTTCITVADVGQGQRLCRLFRGFGRRPFVTPEITRRLPFWLSPTLILTNPRLTARAQAFWRAANFVDVWIPEARGEVCNFACARIILCESAESGAAWGPEAMPIHVTPCAGPLPPFSEEDAAFIAEIQQQLFLLRLEVLASRNSSNLSPEQEVPQPNSSGLRPHLPVFLQREPEIVAAVSPLLEAHEEELKFVRRLDPDVVLRELLWESAHTEKEISTEALTQHLTAELRNRGETLVYNEKEIGWRLTKMGLPRKDNGHNRVLRFSRDVRRRVHRLAAEVGLQLARVAGCPDCQDP